MSDIVEFLRSMAKQVDDEYYRMGEAADEIERLRAELEQAKAIAEDWKQQCVEAQNAFIVRSAEFMRGPE